MKIDRQGVVTLSVVLQPMANMQLVVTRINIGEGDFITCGELMPLVVKSLKKIAEAVFTRIAEIQ